MSGQCPIFGASTPFFRAGQPYKKTLDFLTFRIIQARIDFKECCTSTFLPTSFMLSWGFLECQTGLNHLPYQASRLGHSKTNFGRYQCPKKNMVQWRGLSSQIRFSNKPLGIESIRSAHRFLKFEPFRIPSHQ